LKICKTLPKNLIKKKNPKKKKEKQALLSYVKTDFFHCYVKMKFLDFLELMGLVIYLNWVL
jgi:hypothetical protein